MQGKLFIEMQHTKKLERKNQPFSAWWMVEAMWYIYNILLRNGANEVIKHIYQTTVMPKTPYSEFIRNYQLFGTSKTREPSCLQLFKSQDWVGALTLVGHMNISIDCMLSICPASHYYSRCRICRTMFYTWCSHLWAFLCYKACILGLMTAWT